MLDLFGEVPPPATTSSLAGLGVGNPDGASVQELGSTEDASGNRRSRRSTSKRVATYKEEEENEADLDHGDGDEPRRQEKPKRKKTKKNNK